MTSEAWTYLAAKIVNTREVNGEETREAHCFVYQLVHIYPDGSVMARAADTGDVTRFEAIDKTTVTAACTQGCCQRETSYALFATRYDAELAGDLLRFTENAPPSD